VTGEGFGQFRRAAARGRHLANRLGEVALLSAVVRCNSYSHSMAKPLRRSPLRTAPLRQAGASIQAEIDHLRDDVFMDRLVGLIIVFVMWAAALLQWLFPAPREIFFGAMSVLLVGAAVWALPTMIRVIKRVKALKLGRDGERIVAEHLESVAHDGFWVLHDLPGEGFNIDHVLVGTQGVFTIETKTFSKPALGDARVRFDGYSIRVDGVGMDRDPLVQARAQASWVKRALEDLTGERFPVRPVVVFPGWFVERSREAARSEVWVLEPKELPGWLRREPRMLPPQAVRLVQNRLRLLARQGSS
jgi:hypothetical protein